MNDTLVTLQGNLGGPVRLRAAGETVVASFRLACTPRRYQRGSDTWSDGETQWFTVNAWRGLADNCAASLRTGDAVFVSGRMSLHTWVNADGVEQQTWEVTASAVGHDLNRGTSRFVRPARPDAPPETTAPPAEPEASPDRAEVAA
ncbi:single-stranded DNA-binding protein [Nocardioides dilutus]